MRGQRLGKVESFTLSVKAFRCFLNSWVFFVYFILFVFAVYLEMACLIYRSGK